MVLWISPDLSNGIMDQPCCDLSNGMDQPCSNGIVDQPCCDLSNDIMDQPCSV